MDFIQNERNYDTIHTPRCNLALINQKYADDILKTCTLEVCQWFDHPIHQDIAVIQKQIDDWIVEYEARKCINLAILNQDNEFIGDAEVRHIHTWKLSMGIRLGTQHQGKWYWLEVIKELLARINKSLKYDYIKRECYKDNKGSIAIANEIWAILNETKKTNHWKHWEIDDCVYHIQPPK
jgi:RimJ/RimL family protein N-acetyltransferase